MAIATKPTKTVEPEGVVEVRIDETPRTEHQDRLYAMFWEDCYSLVTRKQEPKKIDVNPEGC